MYKTGYYNSKNSNRKIFTRQQKSKYKRCFKMNEYKDKSALLTHVKSKIKYLKKILHFNITFMD